VDAQALKSALAQPDARDYLAELLALRELMTHGSASSPAVARPSRRWLMAAAAAVVLSLGGGYVLGLGSGQVAADAAAPQPTRVIEVAPGTSNVPQGGR
jgi:hypothetical protein